MKQSSRKVLSVAENREARKSGASRPAGVSRRSESTQPVGQKQNVRAKKARVHTANVITHSPESLVPLEGAPIESSPSCEDFEQLVLNHRENGRKLARSILRRWRVRMPADEIDSVVDLSLCETAKRYSSNRGATFMTFFFYHLRGHLVRTVARAAQGNNVFLAFAKNAGVDAGDLAHLSVEVLHSYVPDYLLFQHRDGDTPENLLIRRERIDQCRVACDKLDALEKEVIDRSFGSEEALVDVAKSLGYSRCHISRVKRSALARLKGALANVVVETPAAEKVAAPRVLLSRSSRRERMSSLRRNRRRSIHASRLTVSMSGSRAA